MNINDVLHTSAEREAAPIGAVIRMNVSEHEDRWTKTGPDLWTSGERPSRSNGGSGWLDDSPTSVGYVVEAWPEANGQALVKVPGDFIYTQAEREAAPIGAQIRPDNLRRLWTKTGMDEWTSDAVPPGHRRNQREPMGGWYSDQRAGSGSYYEVVTWPIVLNMTGTFNTESGPIADYAALLALPVGSVFFYNTYSTTRWRVEPGHRCIRLGDDISVPVNLDVFEGPANAGNLCTGVAADTEVVNASGLSVGDLITSTEQVTALPVGTVLSSGRGVARWTRTKAGPDRWTREGYEDRSDRRLRTDSYFTVQSLPTPAVVHPVPVGEPVETYEQLEAMPLGTVLTTNSRINYERVPEGYLRVGTTEPTPLDSMSTDGYNRVLSYPDTAVESVTEARVWAVGEVGNTAELLDSMPVGTVCQWGTTRHHRTKREDGQWRSGGEHGSDCPSEDLAMSPPWTVMSLPEVEVTVVEQEFTIGMDIETVEQYAALPVYSVVRREGDGSHPVVKRGVNSWQDHASNRFTDASVSGIARTLVALPQGSVTQAAPTEESVTMARHHEIVEERVRHAVEERDEEILATIREHWDGVSFLPGEMDQLMEALSLPPLVDRETITVSVEVSGRTTLNDNDVEALFEGQYSASVDTTEVRWTIDSMEFESIEVDRGDCGCNEVNRSMIEERLNEGGVSFDSFSYEAVCPNC